MKAYAFGIVTIAVITAVLGLFWERHNNLEKIKSLGDLLTEEKNTTKELRVEILNKQTAIDIEKDNYRISQESIVELKKKLATIPEESIVYVTKYIEKPTADKCIVSDEWVSAYEALKNNPYANVSGHKD